MSSDWSINCEDAEDGVRKVTVTSVADSSIQHTNTLRIVDGAPDLSVLTPERLKYLNENVTYRAGDIIVVSYPKCGTTWTEQCVLLLLSEGNNDRLDPSHKNTYIPGSNCLGKIWPEATIDTDPECEKKAGLEFRRISLEDFQNAPDRRVIKSHASNEHLLACNGAGLSALPEGVKVLVVSRNPLDACVSSYYHAFNPFKSGWSFDAWASVWLTGNVTFGCYFQWVKNWFNDIKAHPDRAMWLQYENMQTDPRGQIRAIAAYLEIPVTDELVEKVLKFSSFDSMKADAEAKGGNVHEHMRYVIYNPFPLNVEFLSSLRTKLKFNMYNIRIYTRLIALFTLKYCVFSRLFVGVASLVTGGATSTLRTCRSSEPSSAPCWPAQACSMRWARGMRPSWRKLMWNSYGKW